MIGKNGVNIKRIGTSARLKMQEVGEKRFFKLASDRSKIMEQGRKELAKTGLYS